MQQLTVTSHLEQIISKTAKAFRPCRFQVHGVCPLSSWLKTDSMYRRVPSKEGEARQGLLCS